MKSFSSLLIISLAVLMGCAAPATRSELMLLPGTVAPAPGVLAGGRLKPDDVARLQQAGVRNVIDLTPDEETPEFDEARAVRSAGIGYSNLPLHAPTDLTRENVVAFDRLMRNARAPVLVHCASGNRVGAMAALRAAWLQGKSEEEAVSIGKTWGLKGLEADVRDRIRAGAESRQSEH